jgi:hypothetical protein
MGSNSGEDVWQALLMNQEEHKGLIVLPKCASQYIMYNNDVFKGRKWVSIQPGWPEYCCGYHIAVLIRHPLDRLVSCYEYFRTKNRKYVEGRPIFKSKVSGSFINFCSYVDETSDEEIDQHCKPQSALIAGCAHQFIKWNFDELRDYLKVDIPKDKVNTSKRVDDWRKYFSDPKLLKRMENRYKHDMGHWN